jgi:hypothetical protein
MEIHMGRPPIGKVAMTATERSHRFRAKQRAKQPATKPAKPATKLSVADAATIAALKTRNRELEADVARLTAELSKQQSLRRESRGITIKHTKTGDDARHMMLIRQLGDTTSDRSKAVKALANELQAIGKDFNDLAEATAPWLKEAAQRPSKPKPIDWKAVEAAIARFTEGKSKVNTDAVWRAIVADVPALKDQDQQHAAHYLFRCLRRLGFTANRTGQTYARAEGGR